ncbi:MAG: flagellar biosynthetic protein FliO [Pseudomonadota bacterium]
MNPMPADPVVTSAPELWITLFKSLGMLCIVLVLLIAVLWVLRRVYHHSGGGQPGLIQILASSYVAPKERIVLVDVLGEKLLLGITSQQINLLTKVVDEKDICASPPSAPEGLFMSLLRRKLNGKANSGARKIKGTSI